MACYIPGVFLNHGHFSNYFATATAEIIKSEGDTKNKKDTEKYEKTLDVFISYRRSNGSELASLLDVNLRLKGFTVFLDVKTLKAGKFDDNLLQNIKKASNFVLVLTPNALDNCIGDEECRDWVHREIVAALHFDCNIIPIFDGKFKWPKTEDLPEDIRAMCRFNGLKWVHEYQDAVIEELEKFIRGSRAKELVRRNESYFSSLNHQHVWPLQEPARRNGLYSKINHTQLRTDSIEETNPNFTLMC